MPPSVTCARCGARNRLRAGSIRSGPPPECERCRGPLPLSSEVVEVSDAGFDEQVLSSPLPVLLDVWAPWCVPCRGMEPAIHELAGSLSGRVRVAKLNIDRSPETASRLRIQGVPTVIVFTDGHEVARMIGAREKDELMRALAGLA